jgi:DNA-binding HxlR family transcriptional regulator
MQAYKQAVRAGSDLSLRTQEFLTQKPRRDVGLWIRDSTKQSRLLFSPWSMEILFLVGVFGSLRFGELEEFLGTSSRTLSVKLRMLCKAGFLKRTVESGPPLRTSYSLTRLGRGTAAAASPLMAHVNLAAVGAFDP